MSSLSAGLDTPVGHRGTRLSGGQRQRIAIARALLRKPRLLLLDEAISQLDAENEGLLRDTLRRVSASTTVLLIAHRFSTVVGADNVLVIDQGRVRTQGSHNTLMARDSVYSRLATSQMVSSASTNVSL